MSREIKFRAKDQKGDWNYSSSDRAGFWYGIDDGQYDSETLGQFTGLKDKNGKEIYEGDIIKRTYLAGAIKDGRRWVEAIGSELTAHEFSKILQVKDIRDVYSVLRKDTAMVPCGPTKFEVIGNIWENPELLK